MRLLTILLAASVLPVVCKSGSETPTVQFRMQEHEKEAAAIRSTDSIAPVSRMRQRSRRRERSAGS
jgi:hypothetical protein